MRPFFLAPLLIPWNEFSPHQSSFLFRFFFLRFSLFHTKLLVFL